MENGEDERLDPSSFLNALQGNPVTVKLNSGAIYKGILNTVDGYMHIALDRCKEFHNGEVVQDWGDAFIRGNNVLYISADE